LAAFLWGIDRLMTEPVPEREARTRLLYISPLRALAVDIEKNLRSPLRGIALAAERSGTSVHLPTVGMRTGDTPADARRKLVRNPPDLLITTPESLYLMLTSAARETLRNVDAVIIDEIHSVAGTKRGAHLALTLERLVGLVGEGVQRIGLSATQRPLEEIARFLGGREVGDSSRSKLDDSSKFTVVDAGTPANMDIEVVVPVDDMSNPGQGQDPDAVEVDGPARNSIWPSVHPRILEQIQAHTSTIVFVNSRRLAERLATQLNELWGGDSETSKGQEGLTPGRDADRSDVEARDQTKGQGGLTPGRDGFDENAVEALDQERGTRDGKVPRAQPARGRGAKEREAFPGDGSEPGSEE